MNRNWPATDPTHRSITYQERSLLHSPFNSVAKDSIYRWIEHKDLAAHKVSRLWKFKSSEVDAWGRAGGAGNEGPDNRGGEAQG